MAQPEYLGIDIDLDESHLTDEVPDNVTPLFPVTGDWRDFERRKPLVKDLAPEIDMASSVDARPKYNNVKKGVLVGAKFPEELLRMADILIGREGCPYQTRSDLLRDGLYYLVRCLVEKYAENDPTLLSLMFEARVRADAEHAILWELRLDAFRQDVEDMLSTLGNLAGTEEAYMRLTSWWQTAEAIPHPWERDHYLMVIRDSPLTRMWCTVLTRNGYVLPNGLTLAPALE